MHQQPSQLCFHCWLDALRGLRTDLVQERMRAGRRRRNLKRKRKHLGRSLRVPCLVEPSLKGTMQIPISKSQAQLHDLCLDTSMQRERGNSLVVHGCVLGHITIENIETCISRAGCLKVWPCSVGPTAHTLNVHANMHSHPINEIQEVMDFHHSSVAVGYPVGFANFPE